MGRYAYLKSNYAEDIEIACSGILAQAIHETIGEERFQDCGIRMTVQEVIGVMSTMTVIMGTPVELDYQKVQARETGYRKLSYLMLWYRNALDEGKMSTEILTFI